MSFGLEIDGSGHLTPSLVHAVEAACAEAERAGLLAVSVAAAPDDTRTYADVALVSKWERALRRLERLPATTVSVASGAVGGIALDTLLATDYRIVTPDTRLEISPDGAAAWPGMALYRLVQQTGIAPIRRTVLLGHPLTAAKAMALGLVDEITDAPLAALAVATAAAGLRSGRELAIRRRLMHDATTTSFEEALGAHLAACDRMLRQTSSDSGASR
ncbi:enoyl-CoA hydratase/isomerase family protein [Streptomyces sp. NBC_00631]|uniref:enoyl-CoA-hydratase DpgB n=1 Tax=Streptomyces sp. NBC_00631 TaxID=2975793 RepID=UPI0030E404EA